MSSPRRGIAFTPMETRRDVIVRAAVLADELGYELICVAEGWGFDSTLVLTEISLKTQHIRPMSSILSVWNRSPGTIAMNTATLADISKDRYILGLGASTKTLVEGFHGIPFRNPSAQLRDVVMSVRHILQGERASLPADIETRPLRLGQTPRPSQPIFLAAMGKRAVTVTAELADGWYPAYVTRDYFAGWLPELDQIRQAFGEREQPLTVISGPIVSVHEDEMTARQTVANNLSWYLCAMGDVYAKFVVSQGYEKEVTTILQSNPKPNMNSGNVPQEAQILLDQLTSYGSSEKISEELKQWDKTVDVNVLTMPSGITWDDIETILRAGAPKTVGIE